MVATNYTIQDLFGIGLGWLLFVPILVTPGYVVGWFTGILDFRRLSTP